jgi:hypothetical protein
MDDNDKKKRNKHDKSEGEWTVPNRLKAMSMIFTFLIALGSAIGSFVANKNSSQAVQAVEITRVETGFANTNSNYRDYTNSWAPWVFPVSPRTLYIGVQRNVVFERPFVSIPRVTTALGGVDTKPPNGILTLLGYSQPDKITAERLRHTTIVTNAVAITEKGFTLEVAVGLPTEPGEFLVKSLSGRQGGKSEWPFGDRALIQDMLQNRQLADRSGLNISRNELWLLNFYKSVGTIGVSWIAQSREK